MIGYSPIHLLAKLEAWSLSVTLGAWGMLGAVVVLGHTEGLVELLRGCCIRLSGLLKLEDSIMVESLVISTFKGSMASFRAF